MLRLALLLVLFDTSGKRAPAIRPENLGNSWTHLESREEEGLEVRLFRNHTLNRVEIWTLAGDGRWYLKVRDGLFVHAAEAGDGTWQTRPAEQLVLRQGTWQRVQPKEFRETQSPNLHHP